MGSDSERYNYSLFVCSYTICYYLMLLLCTSDIGALQKEISALEELSRQLFMEYVDMLSVKVGMMCKVIYGDLFTAP